MHLDDLQPVRLPATFQAEVRWLPDGSYGHRARRAFGGRRTTLTVARDELVVDGRRRATPISTPLDQVQFVKIGNASRMFFAWATVDIAPRRGDRLALSVRRPRRLLAALQVVGLQVFTNPAWRGVYAAATLLSDVQWDYADRLPP